MLVEEHTARICQNSRWINLIYCYPLKRLFNPGNCSHAAVTDIDLLLFDFWGFLWIQKYVFQDKPLISFLNSLLTVGIVICRVYTH